MKAIINFKEVVVVALWIISTSLAKGQTSLIIIGKKEKPPVAQWYAFADKRHQDEVFFYADMSSCNAELDILLSQYGDDHTTGGVYEDMFYWNYLQDNGYLIDVTYQCFGEMWLITIITFPMDEDRIVEELITASTNRPFGIVTNYEKGVYYIHQWYQTITKDDLHKGAHTFISTIESCEQQLESILSDYGLSMLDGKPFDIGRLWYVDLKNGYEIYIYYEPFEAPEYSLLYIFTYERNFDEEMELLGIEW